MSPPIKRAPVVDRVQLSADNLQIYSFDTTVRVWDATSQKLRLFEATRSYAEYLYVEADLMNTDVIIIGNANLKLNGGGLAPGTSAFTQLNAGDAFSIEGEKVTQYLGGKILHPDDPSNFFAIDLSGPYERVDLSTIWGISGPNNAPVPGNSLLITVGKRQ